MRIITVSAYRSWNSGVAYKNSSPGCVSNKCLKRGLKSSCFRNSLLGSAIKLKSLRFGSWLCWFVSFQYKRKPDFVSLSVWYAVGCVLLILVPSISLKIVGILSTWEQRSFRSEIGPFSNTLLIASSYNFASAVFMGFPPSKKNFGMTSVYRCNFWPGSFSFCWD